MTYKCPNCGDAIIFDGAQGKFICESCDSVFTQEQLDAALAAMAPGLGDNAAEQQAVPEVTNAFEREDTGELEGMKVYSCRHCGAQIVADDTTAASECPYCNNPVIMTGQLSGMNKPDCIIPFKLDKDAAVAALKRYYRGKRLLPKAFTANNRVKEIKGIYVPFWLFDCSVNADMEFSATKVKTWSNSKYDFTETSHYAVERSGGITFEKVPVDGSSKMDDSYMDAIEPFDYRGMVDFNPAYLSGYLADKYDVDVMESVQRANARIAQSTANAFRSTVSGYSSVNACRQTVTPVSGRSRYALMPVWMLTTNYGGRSYTFAMNGQTGRLVGKLPVDKKKYWGYLLGIAAAIAAIGQLFVF